jgi:trk system potassium uptake protein TrkA
MLVAVIGLGIFGSKTATKLFEQKADVIAIDKDPILVDKIKDKVTRAVCLDVTDEKALRAEDISDVDAAIVAIGDNAEMSILAVATLRKLGVGRVISRAKDNLHEHVLREVGASEIIRIEEEMGELVASKIISPTYSSTL